MEITGTSKIKHIIKYGAFLGITLVIYNAILYFTDSFLLGKSLFKFINVLILVIGTIIGILMFKKKNDGYIKLKEAFFIGLGVSLAGSLLVILAFFLLYNVFDPEMVNKIEARELKNLVQQNTELTQEQIDRKKKDAKQIASPLFLFIIIFLEHLFYGSVTSLVTSLIVQKKKEVGIE